MSKIIDLKEQRANKAADLAILLEKIMDMGIEVKDAEDFDNIQDFRKYIDGLIKKYNHLINQDENTIQKNMSYINQRLVEVGYEAIDEERASFIWEEMIEIIKINKHLLEE